MNDQQNFFKLLKYSNKLKRNNKYLDKQDPEAFDTLLKFLVIIAENFHYSEKHEYINLAKDFLADQITADDFSYAFMGIYEGIGEKLNQMKIDYLHAFMGLATVSVQIRRLLCLTKKN